ncbi:integral membrane protein [Pseudovirgaria hyperparasitica]|uniref:Integral membrane protein n=1 Tax=Pseudovirgaria hyperparasitica TaxID=470096 RepID=A0A6A6W5L1_9PEZI|nr:uncharacterized protein EJ05DRAFT_539272 [Pseudovirgaria hyperparasitica]KAF2757230.1 integral membrane protein [Pseudovirgaria hyperparasitica]
MSNVKAKAKDILHRHPLQRAQSPSRGWSAALHVVALCSFAYSFRYLVVNPNPINDSYGWHMQYLTILGLSLATITMTLALLADITLSPRIFAVKNAFALTSAPMEVLISALYWGLRAYDTSLVLPDWAPRLALSADFGFHLFPTLYLLIDTWLLSPPRTIRLAPSLLLSLVIAFTYWFWIERCYQFNGFYPYPIFALLDTSQRIGLFTFSAVLMTLSGTFLGQLYGVMNGHLDNSKKSQ